MQRDGQVGARQGVVSCTGNRHGIEGEQQAVGDQFTGAADQSVGREFKSYRSGEDIERSGGIYRAEDMDVVKCSVTGGGP